MKRKPFVWRCLVLGGGHFLASLLVVPLTLWLSDVLAAGAAKGMLLALFQFLTRILYFPILVTAFYPRHLFPGHWITIPIGINSLLWGIGLAAILAALVRLRTGR
jgi:hypothetical protein